VIKSVSYPTLSIDNIVNTTLYFTSHISRISFSKQQQQRLFYFVVHTPKDFERNFLKSGIKGSKFVIAC
jgi:hypothetical protein